MSGIGEAARGRSTMHLRFVIPCVRCQTRRYLSSWLSRLLPRRPYQRPQSPALLHTQIPDATVLVPPLLPRLRRSRLGCFQPSL